MDIAYKIDSATPEQISTHLQQCSDQFVPPLNEKVDIVDYAHKLSDKAVCFEAWAGDELAGLIACYFNDHNTGKGFITNVSTIPHYSGKGIASTLLRNCLSFGTENGFSEVLLEVNRHSQPAIRLYQKFRFDTIGTNGDMLQMKHIIQQNEIA